MTGGAHVDARRIHVQLRQLRRFCAALACAHHRLHDYRVGESPEGVADCSQSPQRDRPGRGVTNDAVASLPDHATDRAIRTSVHPALVQTTRLTMSIHSGADSPVSRLCTGRNAGVLMLCTKASSHKPVTIKLVRRHLWMSSGGVSMSRRDSDSEKVPAALYDRLTDTPTYAARMYKVQRTSTGNSLPRFGNVWDLELILEFSGTGYSAVLPPKGNP